MAASYENKSKPPSAVCTGAEVEMICEGGDVGFVLRMVMASRKLQQRVQWYSSMLGKLASVHQVIAKLKEIGVGNWAVTSLRAGRKTRRWAVAWSWGDYRPRNDVARSGELVQAILPFPTAQTIQIFDVNRQQTADIVNATLEALDLRWQWHADTWSGVGRAKENVWSRSARRKQKKVAVTDADHPGAGKDTTMKDAEKIMEEEEEEEEVALAFSISVKDGEVEVIHAGLYYGPDSLKTKLCIKGKNMMYDLCRQHSIPYSNCGKWVVAQDEVQMSELEKVHKWAQALGVPTRFVSPEEAKQREPTVRAEMGILESPTTGIIDSHAYMQYLHGAFEDAGGDTALASPVTRIEPPSSGSPDWKIWTASPSSSPPSPSSPSPQTPGSQTLDETAAAGLEDEEGSFITAETIINSAGLYACAINNMILPPERHRSPYYAKGSYYSYSKSSPSPPCSSTQHPYPVTADVEWVDSPTDLVPSHKTERFRAAIEDIKSYLPGIDESAIGLDYAGIRPKLAKAAAVATGGKGFQDFYIRKEDGYEGFVNLLGIESPGLTSSLAIAEEVYGLLYS
ncbi:hypothetical protein H2203_008617 [Taxawa tesnikishii (nom. ined.)]|nr:hypothetical protein H2203_008617 [Dothideales sp. JES 119]